MFPFPCQCLLNAKSSFISWRRSAFFEVYNWALRYHLSSGISFSAYNDDGVVSIFRHYNNNFHSFLLFFANSIQTFLILITTKKTLVYTWCTCIQKEIFGVSPDFCFCAHDQDQSYLTLQAVDAKTYIGRYLHIVYYTSTTTCLLLEKCWLRA